MTADEVDANYPYVDDMKHVNAVYIENKGKNLLPPFSEWSLHTSTVIKEPYDMSIQGASGSSLNNTIAVRVAPDTDYTLSVDITNTGRISITGADGGAIATAVETTPLTFSSGGNSEITIKFYKAGAETNPVTFAEPMLNLGSEALPFEPQKPSYLYLPDCNLRSNVDGSVTDRLYTDGQGKLRVTRRFRETVLDGALDWKWNIDGAAHKSVYATLAGKTINRSNGILVKYDGKIIPSEVDALSSERIWFSSSLEAVYMSIPDTDSGWGESYTPTADEIKAYFNGWKMGIQGSVSATQYNGTGDKGWIKRSGDGSLIAGTSVTVVPTTPSATFNFYRLMYQLAQSIDEPLAYEGSLMLHEGDNQVEVGTGIVVREATNPILFGEAYYINNKAAAPAGNFKNRTNAIQELFRESKEDKQWTVLVNHAAGNGGGQAYINKSLFDPSAAYSVTYLALDTYAIGIAPQTISAEYAPNIRESVGSLVRELVEARTETSVLANTKAQKQQPQWIAPTLRNGWENYGGGYPEAGYYKDDSGRVHVKGMIKNGTIGTNAFYFPVGYRPRDMTYCPATSNVDFAMVHILPDGSFRIDSGISADIDFNLSFRAEQ